MSRKSKFEVQLNSLHAINIFFQTSLRFTFNFKINIGQHSSFEYHSVGYNSV